MKQFVEYLFVRLFKRFVLLLSLSSARKMAVAISDIFFIILTKRRKIAIQNLVNAFPEKNIKDITSIAKQTFRNIVITFVEFFWFPKFTPELLYSQIKFKNIDLLHKYYRLKKGMIVLSGHFCNWELNALATGFITGYPITIIVKTQSNKLVDKLINSHRVLLGNKVVSMENSVREVLSSLKRGEVVAMLADQSAPKESVFVPFFGKEVATYQGPAIFTLRTRAPLLMGIMVRNPDFTYEVIFEKVPTEDLIDYSDENILELTRRHTTLLESYIRQYPHLWMWTHRRWKNVKDIN